VPLAQEAEHTGSRCDVVDRALDREPDRHDPPGRAARGGSLVSSPVPFEIRVEDAVLDDLRHRLENARFAPDFANEDWRYGVNGTYLRELVAYWRDTFDWRAQESRMNTYSHFRVDIDGVPIHYLHRRGTGPAPIPIVLSHGWPWTFWDFEKVIGPLTDPEAHGGDPADAFDVVVPSLPGFGFSTPLTQTGIDADRTADLWVMLMRDVLGYERFAAYGGDWGLRVTTALGRRHADHVLGIHISGVPVAGLSGDRPWADVFGAIYADPAVPRDPLLAWDRAHAAHVVVHGLDPQTLAFGPHDSPVGLCAWLLERRRAWSDCGGDVERVFSKDELLTTMTLYWVTESFVTSVRYYWEAMQHGGRGARPAPSPVDVPTGISIFVPDAPPGYPLDHIREMYDIHFWREHATGGHFAPTESPEALIEDMRAMFRPLRS
jgi:pimeloyl-ACP methyl ester carboxylesterase